MTESTVGKRGFEPSKITIYVKNRGIVLEESSMALVNRDTGLIMAMGNEAEEAMDAPPTPAVAVNALRGESLPILHCLQICSVFIYTGLWDMITHL